MVGAVVSVVVVVGAVVSVVDDELVVVDDELVEVGDELVVVEVPEVVGVVVVGFGLVTLRSAFCRPLLFGLRLTSAPSTPAAPPPDLAIAEMV